MDITQIAAVAVSSVCYFLTKGGEALMKGVGADLWSLIKKPFTSPSQEKAIEALKANPENKHAQRKVVSKLEDILDNNPSLAKELDLVLKKIPQDIMKSNTQTIVGDDNIANQDINNSTININSTPKD